MHRQFFPSKNTHNLQSNGPSDTGTTLLHQKNSQQTEHTNTNMNTPNFQRIQQLNDKIILQAMQENDHKSCKALLEELQLLIERCEYAGNKKEYFYRLFVVFYNKACLSQQIDKLDDCHKHLEKAIENYQVMQAYAKSRQQTIANNVQYSQILLQLCAVMSQNGKHNTAISLAQKSLNKLIESFRVLSAMCYQNKLLNSEPETKQTSLQADSSLPDRVDFKRIVIKQATKRLAQLSNLPSIHKLILEDKDYYEGIIKNIYFWKDNAENNQKILRKQFDVEKGMCSPRNILGVQKKQSWVQSFHIGSLMCLKPRKLKQQLNSDTYYLLSTQHLLQMAIYCSVCYFTIATEIRFNQFDQDPEVVSISEKYKRLHTNQVMKRCKLIHIKALEIATKYLPPSNFFLNHLLSSFNKNYKFLLDQIGEQSEVFKQGKVQDISEQVSEYGISKVEVKVEKKMTRKRSKTNEKNKKRIQSKSKQGN